MVCEATTWDKDELKARADLRDIVAEAWGPGHRSDKVVMYRARWRNDDHDPSFAVYADGYKDFGGTGDAGDVYNWLEREYGLTFAEAVQWLGERICGPGVQLRLAGEETRASTKERGTEPSLSWFQSAQQALAYSQHYLWSGAQDANRVLAYLRTKRGLNETTIRAFGLGYNPRWLRTAYRVWSEAAGRERRARLTPGIVIPWPRDGVLVALRVRCRTGSVADFLGIAADTVRGRSISKYRSFRGSKLGGALFNGDAVRAGCDVLLVEGEFDAMLAAQMLGERAVVVTLGSATNRLTRRAQEALEPARMIYSVLDQDAAGQEATARLARILGPRHRALRLPVGKDLTEFAIERGGDLRTWFEEATRVNVT